MRWLTKILKGSSHRISKGQYHGKYEDDTIWEGPPASAVIIIIPIICISKRSLGVCYILFLFLYIGPIVRF